MSALPAPVVDYTASPAYQAYSAFLNHVQPRDSERCAECWRADTPSEGCAEGERLWGTYRLARIGKTPTTAP